MSMNFDPMTGQPIEQQQEEMNFDPMTGQPITAGAGAQGTYQIPVTKSGKTRKIVLGVAVVAAVAVIAFSGIVSGAFLGKGNKVLLAVNNTLEDESHLVESLTKSADILTSGKYTIALKGEIENLEADVQFMDATSKKQMRGTVDTGSLEVDFDAYMDQKKIALKVPVFSDKVFTYYCDGENDGYLMEQMDEDDIEALNNLLKTACSSKEQEKLTEDIRDAVLEEYKNLKFESVKKDEFEVDGKDRKCKGYETTITADNVLNVLDSLEDVFAEEYADALKKADVDLDEAFSDMRKDLRNMPDVEATFYLYKNKLACVVVDVEGEEMEIAFMGGDTRTQNIEVEVEGRTVMEVKGDTEDGVERTRLYVMDEEVCTLKYNYKEGKFTLDVPSDLYVEGKLEAKSSNVVFGLEELEVDGNLVPVDLECSVKKGAKIEEIKGEVFDIGTASESDYEEVGKELSNMY